MTLDLFACSSLAPPSATFDSTGRYRFTLTRTWAQGRRVCWVMLNPSTADAAQDDPTIRRCIAFSKREGAGELVVVNLFAFRATDPADLEQLPREEREGSDNRVHILKASQSAPLVVCAWGAHEVARGVDREVLALLERHGIAPMCLGVTKDGHPRHPLYVAGAQPLVPLEPRRG